MRRHYVKAEKIEKAKDFDYIDKIVKLTGYDKDIVLSVLKASELAILDEIACKSLNSNESLAKDISVRLPRTGTLTVKRLYGGRTSDSLMYEFQPSQELHDRIKSAYFLGKTPTADLIAHSITENYTKLYQNILEEEGGNSID